MLQSFLPATGLPLLSLPARRSCYGHDPTQRSAPLINRLSHTDLQLAPDSTHNSADLRLRCPRTAGCGTVGSWSIRLDSRLISKAGAAGVMWVSEWLDCSWPGNCCDNMCGSTHREEIGWKLLFPGVFSSSTPCSRLARCSAWILSLLSPAVLFGGNNLVWLHPYRGLAALHQTAATYHLHPIFARRAVQ